MSTTPTRSLAPTHLPYLTHLPTHHVLADDHLTTPTRSHSPHLTHLPTHRYHVLAHTHRTSLTRQHIGTTCLLMITSVVISRGRCERPWERSPSDSSATSLLASTATVTAISTSMSLQRRSHLSLTTTGSAFPNHTICLTMA
jgi:hypothetical protein